MPMEVPTTSPKTAKAYEALVAEMTASTPSQPAKMMGMPCLKTNGKMYAGLWGDSVTFKLGPPTHGEALALKGAALFDPSGMNRPMKEWVAVPVAHAKRWSDLANAAFGFVGSQRG